MRRCVTIAGMAAVLIASSVHAAAPVQFVRFSPIIVSIMDNNRIAGLLSITVHCQAPDDAARKQAELLKPRLQDIFTRTVLELGELYIAPDRRIDFDMVTARLQAAATATAPNARLKVYVIDASTRKL